MRSLKSRPVEAPPVDPPGRAAAPRTMTARTMVVVLASGLLLGALLNAGTLAVTAAGQPPGWRRDIAVTATDVLGTVSGTLRLDRPRAWIDDAFGRAAPGAAIASGPASPGGVFVPTPDRPARLLVAGDSLTDTFGPALVNRSGASGVVEGRREIQFSSGLNRVVYDWPVRLADQLAEHRADIVVFLIGANDGVPIETPTGWVGSDTEAWKVAYGARVAAAMEVLAARVPTVYWVGMPIVRSEQLARKVAVMNEIFRREAERHPGVRYVDPWALFADTSGGYTPSLPDGSGRTVPMRRTDGVHFTPAGAERLTDAVWTAIRRDWRIKQ